MLLPVCEVRLPHDSAATCVRKAVLLPLDGAATCVCSAATTYGCTLKCCYLCVKCCYIPMYIVLITVYSVQLPEYSNSGATCVCNAELLLVCYTLSPS